jgi:outer membrane protein
MNTRFLSCLAGVIAITAPFATPAAAQAAEGKIQIKLLATAVLPDGKISTVREANVALPAGSDTSANDNVVPTIAVEYFFSDQLSVETICCLTSHHVNGAGAIAGVDHLIDNVLILPATLTLKYHLTGLGPIKPYVGAGPSYFLVLDSKVGAGGQAALGAASADVKSKLGFALQAGVDIPVGPKGFGISFDAKRYFMRPIAAFYNAAGATILETRHELDPWVVSGGISYRF